MHRGGILLAGILFQAARGANHDYLHFDFCRGGSWGRSVDGGEWGNAAEALAASRRCAGPGPADRVRSTGGGPPHWGQLRWLAGNAAKVCVPVCVSGAEGDCERAFLTLREIGAFAGVFALLRVGPGELCRAASEDLEAVVEGGAVGQ